MKMEVAKSLVKEISNKSREFFEFVLPPIDIELEDDLLLIKIDIPGFKKENIHVTLSGNILSIKATKKKEDKPNIICKQRPNKIDKKILLPVRIKEGEEQVKSAKYVDGVLTITIQIPKKGKEVIIE